MYDYDHHERPQNRGPGGLSWIHPTDSLDGHVNNTDPDYQVRFGFQEIVVSSNLYFQLFYFSSNNKFVHFDHTVWPEVGVKSGPNPPKVAPKVSTAVFCKSTILHNSPKCCSTFGLLLKEICPQELSKIAQSGHTATSTLRRNSNQGPFRLSMTTNLRS